MGNFPKVVSCPSQVSTQVRTRNREKKLRLGVGREYGDSVNHLRGPAAGRPPAPFAKSFPESGSGRVLDFQGERSLLLCGSSLLCAADILCEDFE